MGKIKTIHFGHTHTSIQSKCLSKYFCNTPNESIVSIYMELSYEAFHWLRWVNSYLLKPSALTQHSLTQWMDDVHVTSHYMEWWRWIRIFVKWPKPIHIVAFACTHESSALTSSSSWIRPDFPRKFSKKMFNNPMHLRMNHTMSVCHHA